MQIHVLFFSTDQSKRSGYWNLHIYSENLSNKKFARNTKKQKQASKTYDVSLTWPPAKGKTLKMFGKLLTVNQPKHSTIVSDCFDNESSIFWFAFCWKSVEYI